VQHCDIELLPPLDLLNQQIIDMEHGSYFPGSKNHTGAAPHLKKIFPTWDQAKFECISCRILRDLMSIAFSTP